MREESWKDPRVRKNWEEFNKKVKMRGEDYVPSEKPFDYEEIRKMREESWKDPRVRKNWEEFNKKREARYQNGSDID